MFESLETRALFDGAIDTFWGENGIVRPQLNSSTGVTNVDVGPGGNAVSFGPWNSGLRAVTYNDDGSTKADASFGFDGLTAVHADGRLVAASQFGLALYAADGSLVRQFIGGQLSGVPNGKENRFFDLSIAPNGDVIVSGQIGTDLLAAEEAVVDWAGVEIYSADGQLKRSIQNAVGGKFVAGFGDGRILAGGGNQVACYLPTGELDPTFANGAGFANVTEQGGQQRDLLLDQYGRIYVVWTLGGNPDTAQTLVTRFKPFGARDKAWGVNGTVNTATLDLNGGQASLNHTKVAVSPDGMVYAAEMISTDVDWLLGVGRFTAGTGQRDTTWGTNGVATADYESGGVTDGEVRDIVVLPEGDVIVATVNQVIGWKNSFLIRFDGPDLAAGEPLVKLLDGRLIVTGTAGNDLITASSNSIFGVNVTANGVLYTFDELEVQTIVISAGAGADYVDLRDLANLPFVPGIDYPVTIDGGDGNDVLVGHQGKDRITGGNDDDKVHGWTGDDWVSGNAQKDRVIGGAGKDLVNGNGGRDFLVGEDGNDTLLGGDQPDTLLGMAGNDSMMGEGGHDRIDGGDGLDFMSGGGGNDTFISRDGDVDTIVGGLAGTDRAQVDDEDSLVGIEALLA